MMSHCSHSWCRSWSNSLWVNMSMRLIVISTWLHSFLSCLFFICWNWHNVFFCGVLSAISLLFYLWKFKDTDAMISWLVSAYLTSSFSLKFHLWFLVSSALMRCFCVPGVKCSRLWDPNIWIGVQTTYWQGAIFQKTFFWEWFPMQGRKENFVQGSGTCASSALGQSIIFMHHLAWLPNLTSLHQSHSSCCSVDHEEFVELYWVSTHRVLLERSVWQSGVEQPLQLRPY
jgi:hypothetical protein